MSSVTSASGTTSYLLDALGQRVKKSGPAGTRLFVYDEAGHLLGEYDASGALIQETIWMGDIPVATLQSNGAGGVNVFYVHTDHLNTPRRISRPSDDVIVWRWDSDPFGTSAANEDPDGDSNLFAYNLRFPGQYFDAESGLQYNYFRDYDPYASRYVQSDPIGLAGGLNTYAYVGGNPLMSIDPTGEEAVAEMARRGWGLPPPPPPPNPWRVLNDTYREGQQKNVRGTDQFFHCLAACRALKNGSTKQSIREYLNSKEYLRDYPLGRLSLYGQGGAMSHQDMIDDIQRDQQANEQGLACPPSVPCEKACSSLLDNLPVRYRQYMTRYRTVW